VPYGEYAMKKSIAFEWHRRFKEGWEDVQDGPRSGQPKTQKTDAIEQTVNQQRYLEVLTRLRESVSRKRPELWPDKWTLHHDNAPAHGALRVREFLAKKSLTKMDHPAYSPDLAPCDFWFFPKLKNVLMRQRFADIPDIQCNVTLLRGIEENDFQHCFRQWHHSHDVHSFIRRVFRRRQQPLLHKQANFAFTGPFRKITVATCITH
jgi:hypothetical protein